MSKKTLAAALLLTFVFALAPATGAGGSQDLVVPDVGFPAEVERAGEPLLAATTGGTNWSCIGAVLGFSFVALGAGAVAGPAGLAVAGAYAPIALVACG